MSAILLIAALLCAEPEKEPQDSASATATATATAEIVSDVGGAELDGAPLGSPQLLINADAGTSTLIYE